jgi:hypothetical protein
MTSRLILLKKNWIHQRSQVWSILSDIKINVHIFLYILHFESLELFFYTTNPKNSKLISFHLFSQHLN